MQQQQQRVQQLQAARGGALPHGRWLLRHELPLAMRGRRSGGNMPRAHPRHARPQLLPAASGAGPAAMPEHRLQQHAGRPAAAAAPPPARASCRAAAPLHAGAAARHRRVVAARSIRSIPGSTSWDESGDEGSGGGGAARAWELAKRGAAVVGLVGSLVGYGILQVGAWGGPRAGPGLGPASGCRPSAERWQRLAAARLLGIPGYTHMAHAPRAYMHTGQSIDYTLCPTR